MLKPGQWPELLKRLEEIENPVVPTKPSPYALPTRRLKNPGGLYGALTASHELLREAREHVGALVGHGHQVLDPHAQPARQVDARLDRHHVARHKGLVLLGPLAQARLLVHLHAHAVAQPVAETLAVAGLLDHLAGLARPRRGTWRRREPLQGRRLRRRTSSYTSRASSSISPLATVRVQSEQ